MRKPEPFQPLPNFDWQLHADSAAVQHYRRFYHLELAEEFAGLRHAFGTRQLPGGQLLLQAFILPDNRAHVFLLHGYLDHIGLYGHLIRALLAAGFNVVGLDLPGHGLSAMGKRAGIDGFQQYQQVIKPLIEEARQQLPGDWFLLGQSTGGAIAMDYVMNNPGHHFNKLVLLAPLVIPVRWSIVKFELFALRLLLRWVPRSFTRNSSDRSFLRFIRREDPLQSRVIRTSWVQSLHDWQQHFDASPASSTPTLLIQGDKDVVVAWRYNVRRIREKFRQLQEYFLPGANHHLVNEAAPIRQQLLHKLTDFLNQT